MRIALTGSTGGLGSLLLRHLRMTHEVVTLGRENCNVSWTLGVIPSPEEVQGIDALIHCAWSTQDRRRDFHINIGGTAALARFADVSEIPMLFISSVAALSDSYYGIAKREAEILVEQHHGSTLRIGLVPQSNPYFELSKKFIGLAPFFSGYINLTEFHLLSKSIDSWLEQIISDSPRQMIKTSISANVLAREQFLSQYRYAIPVPTWLLLCGLTTFQRVSLKSANLLDAWKSLTTTPRILP